MALWFAAVVASAQPLIVDTDAGSDDVLAVALLLAHRMPIDAITVVNGMAHVGAGARTMRQLLEIAGAGATPVYEGRNSPLRGAKEFPADWRTMSDGLLRAELPAPSQGPKTLPAADYLVRRLSVKQPRHVRILALGPLTNIAEALRGNPEIARSILEIVIMGGAVRWIGNAPNKTAEWNMYIDPFAAQIVFRCGVPIRLIALNATSKVPIGRDFVRAMQAEGRSPLGHVVAQVLAADRDMIDSGSFYAWDPLAAAALLDPRVVVTQPTHVEVRDDGTTLVSRGAPNAEVAVDARPAAFRALFMESLSSPKGTQR